MTEDGLERLVIQWLVELGWQHAFGPDIAPDMLGAERGHYREVISNVASLPRSVG